MLVTQAHFGSNIMYGGHNTAPGSPLHKFADWVGATNFRYPGGTVTERMSHKDGSLNEIFNDDHPDIVTLKQALEFAEARDGDITFVLPTHTFLTEGEYGNRDVDTEALSEFLIKISDMLDGKYGPPVFRTFEIGNEWWYLDERMTAEEYGKIANAYAKGLSEVFEIHKETLDNPDDWVAPNIAVQTGAYWRGPESNSKIIELLDPEAKDAINMVIAHYYPRNLEQAMGKSSRWDAIQEFLDDEEFGELKVLISEWNISRHSENWGMNQASLLTETFKTMIKQGVDEANIWGTNYKNLSTKLAEMSHNRWEDIAPEEIDVHLTPAGEAYRMMAQNLVGKKLIDVDVENVIVNFDKDLYGGLILSQAYGSDEQITIFISNMGEADIHFELNDLLIPDDFTHVWAQYMTAHDDPRTEKNEGDPNSMDARGLVTTLNSNSLFDDYGKISLGANSFMKVTYTLDSVGVVMRGTDQLIDPYLHLSDHLIGGSGNDTIFGNLGDDLLEGGDGNNLIFGGAGNDTIIGGNGNDMLFGEQGENKIIGGEGDNFLVSGGNFDTLVGGSGNDLFFVAGSSSEISGNGGVNLFHFEGSGAHKVIDFNPENGDLISFGGKFKDNLEFITSLTAAEGDVEGQYDLIIKNEEIDLEVKLIGMGDLISGVDDLILDFFPSPERAEELSHYFNDLDGDQFLAFSENILQGEELSIFSGIDAVDVDRYFAQHIKEVLIPKIDPNYEILNTSSVDGISIEEMEFSSNNLPDKIFDEKLTSNITDESDIELESRSASDLVGSVGDSDILTRTYDWASFFTRSPSEDYFVSLLNRESRLNQKEEEISDEEEDDYKSLDGSCFVATATYRDPLHPDVVFLRRFRDELLRTYLLGRVFIKFYWIVGPFLAIPVRRNDVLARGSRYILKLLIAFIRIRFQ